MQPLDIESNQIEMKLLQTEKSITNYVPSNDNEDQDSTSCINCIGRSVYYISIRSSELIEDSSKKALLCIKCCVTPEVLCTITAIGILVILTVGAELLLIAGAYYCINEPDMGGSLCFKGYEVFKHSIPPVVAGVIYAVSAAVFPWKPGYQIYKICKGK